MLSPAKNATTPWRAIRRFVALTLFVVFSMISHQSIHAAQLESQAHAAHVDVLAADHCHGEPCLGYHDGQISCCGLGHCGVPLPAPPCAPTRVSPLSAYPHHPFEIALRWGNAGVDRPPKST